MPAGSHISAEILYYGTGAPVADSGSLGLYFSSAPAAPRAVTNLALKRTARQVPPPVQCSRPRRRSEKDTNVLALQPQLIPGVASIEVAARKPDGATQILLFARNIPLAWPTPYVFATPVPLPKGTRLSVIEHYAAGAALRMPASAVTSVSSQEQRSAPSAPQAPAQPEHRAALQAHGTVKSVDSRRDVCWLSTQHSGFMGAMTMSYSVEKSADLERSPQEIRSSPMSSRGAAGTYLQNIKVIKKAH